MLCRQALERWLRFTVYSVFLEEKCAIDKLLWRQQRDFEVRVVVIPFSMGGSIPKQAELCILCALN